MGHGPGSDQLLFPQILDGKQTIPHAGCPFELQRFRGALHLFAKLVLHLLVLSLQNKDHLANYGTVILLTFSDLAPTVAVSHMVIQARTIFSLVAGKCFAAARKPKRKTDGIHELLRHISSAIGAKIGCAVFHHPICQTHHRIFFPQIDAQIRIPFIILQQNIIFWHVPFDQRALQHQRFKLRGCHNNIKMMNL